MVPTMKQQTRAAGSARTYCRCVHHCALNTWRMPGKSPKLRGHSKQRQALTPSLFAYRLQQTRARQPAHEQTLKTGTSSRTNTIIVTLLNFSRILLLAQCKKQAYPLLRQHAWRRKQDWLRQGPIISFRILCLFSTTLGWLAN